MFSYGFLWFPMFSIVFLLSNGTATCSLEVTTKSPLTWTRWGHLVPSPLAHESFFDGKVAKVAAVLPSNCYLNGYLNNLKNGNDVILSTLGRFFRETHESLGVSEVQLLRMVDDHDDHDNHDDHQVGTTGNDMKMPFGQYSPSVELARETSIMLSILFEDFRAIL